MKLSTKLFATKVLLATVCLMGVAHDAEAQVRRFGGGTRIQQQNTRVVPNFVGLNTNVALRAAQRAGFRLVVRVTGTRDRANAGRIIRQSIRPGTPRRGRSPVVIVFQGRFTGRR